MATRPGNGRPAQARNGDDAMTVQPGWDDVYVADEPPPWDIGRPQPVFARLADQGLLRGVLLDSGCGTGENTMLAAGHGADALGVDVSPNAIAQARRKAGERGSAARFQVADVLDLGQLGLVFDTVVDSGVFHVFDDADRARYVASDQQPGDAGPRRVSQDELIAAFGNSWTIDSITAETFAINFEGRSEAQAWLATIERS
jgi:SAM-dependent methyltransferase